MIPCAILCGGLGTRLRPLTDHRPKSMVDVAGKPFLFHQLDLLKSQGVSDVVLCIGHLGHAIQGAVALGDQFGLNVRYSHDGAKSLGTAGALRKALPLLGDEFFVLYGDMYLECDYEAVYHAFKTHGKHSLMAVWQNNNRLSTSNVMLDGYNVMLYHKRVGSRLLDYIDYGLSVFKREVFIDSPISNLSLIQSLLAEQRQLAAFKVPDRYYSIGSPNGLSQTEAYLKGKQDGKETS